MSASYTEYEPLPSLSVISTLDTSGITTTGTFESPEEVRVREKVSVSSNASSSIMVTLKHCL